MRLLQVLAGGLYGGAERFYEDLVLGLAKAGLDQACAIRPFPLRAARLSAAGCRVSQFMFGGVFDIFTRMRLAKLAKLEGPDVILGWMNRACAILPEGPWVNVGRLGGYYSLKYYRRCHHLVCNTPDIRDYVIREGWPVERAHYIPNFTPVEEGPPVDRAALDTPKDAKVLLILARLHKVKGIDVAIRALRHCGRRRDAPQSKQRQQKHPHRASRHRRKHNPNQLGQQHGMTKVAPAHKL